MKKFCIVFICQYGELEIKSALLAASLRHYLGHNIELVAAIPFPHDLWGAPKAETLAFLSKLKVRTELVYSSFGKEYPIGNKISALGVSTDADATIFLDSDILCLQKFIPSKIFSLPFSAKPADMATYGKERGLWDYIYKLNDLSPPSSSVITTHTEEIMAPYFNAGVVCVENGKKFAAVWNEVCLKIDSSTEVTNTGVFLDQIGLPVALEKMHYNFQCLDERSNYPAHLKPINVNHLPILCHYHWPEIIAREPTLRNLIQQLIKIHPEITHYFNIYDNWKQIQSINDKHQTKLLPSQNITKNIEEKNFFITGIPRSGTSLLCKLLHEQDDCVVINEPNDIFHPLKNEAIPWGITNFYANTRRNILSGQQIENKLKDGLFIEDTAVVDEHSFYTPKVSKEDFLLGSKNTLSYMARLERIRQIAPQSPIIGCIRNPYDTIASWKNTFKHLNKADLNSFPIGHPKDPFLDFVKRRHLQEMMGVKSDSERRALLWRYLAKEL